MQVSTAALFVQPIEHMYFSYPNCLDFYWGQSIIGSAASLSYGACCRLIGKLRNKRIGFWQMPPRSSSF